MKRRSSLVVLLALAVLPAACSKPAPPAASAVVAAPAIDGNVLLQHVKVLASDEYEGRAPGTKGEDLTIAYITDQFKKAGVQPGNPDGSYLQKVPMVGITPAPDATLVFAKGARQQKLKWRDDYVAWTKRVTETVSLDKSDMVFVGYGVHAPEYNWDDYKGLDLRGKTMVVLIGDPPVPDPNDPSKLDPKFFGGRAMTYYGRWSYKYEMGQKMGAAGVIIVHETEPAAYPFVVVQGKTGEQFSLVAPDQNMSRAAIEGWITLEQAQQLFKNAGKDFDTLKKAALNRDFRPVALGTTASLTLHNTLRTIDSHNVVAKLQGSDPKLKDEYVVYTAHWDHFGIGVPVNGDKVYHGAVDNATGVAALIELARAYKALPVAPKRSIVFLAVTAEEQGLLGSGYYALNPLYPLNKTLAVVNMDGLNVLGKTRDIEISGYGNSDLDEYAGEVAKTQGRVTRPDSAPEKGGFYRSDHFPFAQQGVPAITSGSGVDFVGKPEGWGAKKQEEFVKNDYHKPTDNVRPDWDMSGAVLDAQYYFLLGYKVAQADRYPEWKPGTEFKATRDAQVKPSRAPRP